MDMEHKFRTEEDLLGKREIPKDALYGIHTLRALENFPISNNQVHPALIQSFGIVKLACAKTNHSLGMWENENKAYAIERACQEMADGLLSAHIVVDALQGGAGTSTNMNINEVIANRALSIMGLPYGDYEVISPTDDINLHQSTNDTYPTALKLASIELIRQLEERIVALQETFQAKEKAFSHVVKIGRTQFQDAVLTTLGREMSAYAEALTRDRWRVYKCEERLRVVNLGGTAIGTGLGAPRQYIFQVVDQLRALTNIGFARSENLVEGTQNADVFVEVSGILKALASTLIKISNDLRFLSSGPEAGIGEIKLPQKQAGSSIMPGKVNPVIPEAIVQTSLMVMAFDQTIASAVALGHLELNAFLPLIAHCLLNSISLLTNACETLRKNCIEDLEANEEQCQKYVEASSALATALVPKLGYELSSHIAKDAKEKGQSIRKTAISGGYLTEEEFNELITPEAVSRLGSPAPIRRKTQ